MQNIFGILFLLSFVGLILAVVRPVLFNKWARVEWTRKRWVLIMLGALVVFFILTGATAPKTPEQDKSFVGQEQSGSANQPAAAQNLPTVSEAGSTPATISELYTVIKVVDGDTLAVNINGKSETLRLIGINTPEIVDPRKPVECFGKEASDKAKEILTGKRVRLEADIASGELDKYNRLLRYVFLEDGTSYNKMMISEGYAYEYTYNGIPYKYQAEYKQAQKDAEAKKRGLWAGGACGAASFIPSSSTSSSSQTAPSPAPSSSTPQTPTTVTTNPITSGDKDCKDFKTHAEAQAYFNAHGGSATYNFDRLDGNDHDGIVCETLP